jgi:flagellar hook protein FlgE
LINYIIFIIKIKLKNKKDDNNYIGVKMINTNISSMIAQQDWMNNSAKNIANLNTDGYKATNTLLKNDGNNVMAKSEEIDSGTNMIKELTDQINIEVGYMANAIAIKTQDGMTGSLLDITG